MDNLQLQYAYNIELNRAGVDDEDDPVVSFCLDSTEEGVLYAATHTGTVQCFQQLGKKLLWSVPLPLEALEAAAAAAVAAPAAAAAAAATACSVAAFAHVVELDALFIAARNGQLLLLDTSTKEVDEVGVVTGGVAAAGWSPDGEQLAVLGFNGLLLIMNKEWDVLTEVAVPPPEQQQQQLLSATLTWRGDSSYLATNTLWGDSSSSSSNSRVLHIWDRETGQLHATGQSTPGLSAAVAWQPNCRHLFAAAALPPPAAAAAAAGQQQLRAAPHQRVVSAAKSAPAAAAAAAGTTADTTQQQQQDSSWSQHIVLYERNGLQHGGFDVPSASSSSSSSSSNSSSSGSDVVIHSLHWSSDSRLLAVVLAPPAALQQQQGQAVPHEWRLQLWCRSNWHWHLKHEQRHELPDVSGGLLVCWDESLPCRLHLLSGAGRYSRLDFGWCTNISGRGTAAVIDGHQVLLTPLRHGLVPPPMCAVRALLPRPAVALAWCDGDMEGDMDSLQLHQQQQQQQQQLGSAAGPSNGHHTASTNTHSDSAANGVCPAGPVGQPNSGSKQGSVNAVASGYCETLVVLLSDGQLVFFRAVESDLWEETLEDQIALGGPRDYLIPLGLPPAAAAAAAAAGSSGSSRDKMLLNDAEYYGGLSIPSGPWSRHYGSAITAVSAQGGDVQRLQFPPLDSGLIATSSSSSSPAIPLAEGRTVLGLVWLSQQRLLLLAAPLDEGLEEGEGTVLIEVSVTLPGSLNNLANDSTISSSLQQGAEPEPETQSLCVSYARARVLTASSHPAGGAMLQLQTGQLMYYPPSSSSSSLQQQLQPLPAAASFPGACSTLLLLPHAPPLGNVAAHTASVAPSSSSSSRARQAAVRVAAAAPAVGLSAAGVLYWGNKVVAADVVSVAVRGGGPGGPALLYITRQSVLYVVMIAQLPTYKHTLPDESSGMLTWKRSEHPGELYAAISHAMRPTGAAAATHDPHMRAVEQGAVLLAVPYGGIDTVLVMPRGNLEGICPRLLVLAAIAEALDAAAFGTAWELAVTHRVDLNLLVDYAWPRFLDSVDAFVSAVPSASDLGDLLLALTPTSTLQPEGIYAALPHMMGWQHTAHGADPAAAGAAAGAATGATAGAAAGAAAGALAAGAAAGTAVAGTAAAGAGGGAGVFDAPTGSAKVSRVCAAVRSAVLRLPGRYVPLGHLKTVVMSYARSNPPSLEGALAAIRDVKEAAVAHTAHPQQLQQQQQQQQQTGADPVAAPDAPTVSDTVSSDTDTALQTVTAADLCSPPELSAAADAALKHLLLYVDVDLLYQAALGLYDLPLAFMAVSHSQKDPGEYLAELSRFGVISNPQLQRHAIDMSLGRWGKALENLVAAGAAHFDQALKLARDKGLLRQLLALTQQQQLQQQQQQQEEGPGVADGGAVVLSARQRLVAVLSAYGDALMASRKAEDAAVAYSAAGLMDQALGAYRAAGAWRMSMVLSARLQHSPQQQQELARDLAEQLLASGAGADAAVLLAQHLGDIDGAVSALITAKEWREGLRVAYAHGRADLVDTDLVPAAAQAAAVLLSDANEAIERITKYSARLVEVRQRRVSMAAALSAAEAEAAAAAGASGAVDIDDLISEAPSMISGFSIYTDRTSAGMTGIGGSSAASSHAASTIGGRKPMRGSKKAAKKGLKGKKIKAGAPGEEAGLEAHLLTLTPAKHVLEEAGQLSELLVMLQHTVDATKLQQRVGQWQAAAAEAVTLVAQGQQQQPAASNAGGDHAQHLMAAASAAAAAATAAAADVRWKWDVLREHKA